MNGYDKAIMEALEMFNKALKSAKKPKIESAIRLSGKMAPNSGWQRRKGRRGNDER
ncbi:MAG: hypothetical protein ACLT4X_02785 [Phascolarctobacterium sp.]